MWPQSIIGGLHCFGKAKCVRSLQSQASLEHGYGLSFHFYGIKPSIAHKNIYWNHYLFSRLFHGLFNSSSYALYLAIGEISFLIIISIWIGNKKIIIKSFIIYICFIFAFISNISLNIYKKIYQKPKNILTIHQVIHKLETYLYAI